MDTKQLVLKLALETAGQSLAVDSLDDRMRLQKAIYLLQANGANLGYRYSWYLKGPYSTSLTQDYFAIAEVDGESGDSRSLKAEVAEKIRAAAKILTKPTAVRGLSMANWYELIASLHFLHKVEGYNGTHLKRQLAERKPHLAQHIDAGIDHLKKFSLL